MAAGIPVPAVSVLVARARQRIGVQPGRVVSSADLELIEEGIMLGVAETLEACTFALVDDAFRPAEEDGDDGG